MAYRMVCFRIQSNCYNTGYSYCWASDAEKTAFREESRRIFQELGWTIHDGGSDACDTVSTGDQKLHLQPNNFNGVIDEANVQSLQERLSKAQAFRCYAVDCYEEYLDMSDEEYRAALEAKRGEITDVMLEQCKTKDPDLYIIEPVAELIAHRFEICRLCDKDRNNSVGKRFVAELMAQLVQEGWLVTAETDQGEGIRTATEKELGARRQSTEQEQVEGQITMMF